MKKIWLIILIIAVVFLAFFFRKEIFDFYSKLILRLPEIEKNLNDLVVKKIEKQIFNPPPLRTTEQAPESFLTKKGVIDQTNAQRAKYGLAPLKENLKLDSSAEIKVKDMFNNQYFAHESPSGKNISDLAGTVGYDFIVIGENLALGNFKDDQTVLQAWMDSEGHRANILNPKYKEIGVAVMQGVFEGKTTWMAVQHFGTPLSACAEPSYGIKSAIESYQVQIQELQRNLDLLAEEIKNTRFESQKDYKQKIDQYNNLVAQYNNLVSATKNMVSQYNVQVQAFNQCISSIQ